MPSPPPDRSALLPLLETRLGDVPLALSLARRGALQLAGWRRQPSGRAARQRKPPPPSGCG